MVLQARHTSDWAPGRSWEQTPLPRGKGKLTMVLKVLGIFRTSEWKGCAAFV